MMDPRESDRANRRLALAILAGGTIVGAAIIWAWEQYRPLFEDWVREEPVPKAGAVLAALAVFTIGPLLAMAAYLWRAGGKMPRHSRLMRLLAGTLGVGGVLLGLLLSRLAALFER